MSGILEKKSRILDTIITQEGRKKLSTGGLNISFVAFSDSKTFYKSDLSGSADAQSRVYLEAANLPQDQITFESDDSGKLSVFKGGNLGVLGGKVLSGSNVKYLTYVTGSDFSTLASTVLSSSLDSFDKLRVIGSSDPFLDDEKFRLSHNVVNFSATNNSPISPDRPKKVSIDDTESLFQDNRLSHLPNFKFLPPVNKPTIEEPNGSSLGNYLPIGQREILTFEELLSELPDTKEVIEFSLTSRENNVAAQFFEIMPNEIKKLEVIDFGSFLSNDPIFPEKRVFFVGKLFTDNYGSHTFVNVFTLIFS